jgi:ABC-type multidrug transport system ATPase subunit
LIEAAEYIDEFSVVEKICDRALIIPKGHLIAEGTVEDLKAFTGQAPMEMSTTESGTIYREIPV